MAGQQLKIRTAKLDELLPFENNPREHAETNLEMIRGSLVKFGQVEPLVVQDSTGRVVGGNGRLQVMRSLGWETAYVVRLDLTDEQARALNLALNRAGELSTWNADLLRDALNSLADAGWDVPELGWSQEDVAALNLGYEPLPEPAIPVADAVDQDKPKQGRPINLTVEQREVFERALVKLRAAEGDMTEGRCCELLSADWLSRN